MPQSAIPNPQSPIPNLQSPIRNLPVLLMIHPTVYFKAVKLPITEIYHQRFLDLIADYPDQKILKIDGAVPVEIRVRRRARSLPGRTCCPRKRRGLGGQPRRRRCIPAVRNGRNQRQTGERSNAGPYSATGAHRQPPAQTGRAPAGRPRTVVGISYVTVNSSFQPDGIHNHPSTSYIKFAHYPQLWQ